MSVKTRKFTLFSAALAAVILLVVSFSACESTLGFGDPIDWEPPVLKLDSNRNPRYVGDNTQLMGTVTDNIAVGRVELRYAIPDPVTREQIKLGEAVLSGDNPRSKSWSIELKRETFEEWAELLGYDKIDGAKIPVEIVAYDTSQRSGDTSIRAISLIIDLSPPVVENTWITRTLSTPMRIFYLESLEELEKLAETDPRGEVNGNVDKYQNGWFYIDAQLTEEETKIEELRLQIYDTRYAQPLFLEGEYVDEDGTVQYRGIERDKKSNNDFSTPVTAPRWLIKEEALIAAGEANLFPSYKTNYDNGQRYYYEVVISALDMSENEGRWKNADEGFFIMWEKGDVPKGFLDLVVGGADDDDSEIGKVTRTKGDLLPVEFFDDDSLSWAYTDLLTLDQWRGYKEGGNYTSGPAVYLNDATPQLRMPDGTDEAKLTWLKEQLRAGKTILNWKNDKGYYNPTETKQPVTELLGGKTPDEKTAFIQTGTRAGDYGDYVLFTLVGDKKLSPHDPAYSGPLNTLKDRWAGSKWDVLLVDDNKPMIVFDTVNVFDNNHNLIRRGSPEENTFPLLDEGRYFTIHGYTLRQCNEGETNSVSTLHMAWIPYIGTTPGAQAALGTRVVTALEEGTAHPNQGEQYWTLTLTDHPITGQPEYEPIGGVRYRKQYFTKTFDILGGTAANGITLANYKDASPGKTLNNAPSNTAKVNEAQFVYNNKLENETKLFVFVAIDSTRPDNVVNKQLPILGRTTPPKLSVYDISDREIPAGSELSPPDIYDYANTTTGIIDDAARAAYHDALNIYNALSATFTAMSNIATYGNEPLEEALSLQIYPRGKTLLYWVQAEEAGDLLIQNIVMEDTTYSTPVPLGNYQQTAKRLSYVETLPEVTQRVFRFTATDTLGNERQIQRTVTITSTAMLTDISTPKPNGTYGISVNTNNTVAPDQDDRITIYARFSNRIVWEGTNPPLLNVRYENPGGTNVIRQIPTITPPIPSGTQVNPDLWATLSLEFRFSIPEGAAGTLQTMYDSPSMTGTVVGTQVGDINRPITLPTGTRIVDVSRAGERVSAFIPGYAFDGNKMETWRTNKNSLHPKKTILLDGVRPSLIVVSSGAYLPVSGKAAFTNNGGDFYFKSNETITFTLKADKRIQPNGNGNPRIQFYIGDANTGGNQAGPYYANYERASGIDGMIFTFPLSLTVSPPYANANNTAVRDGIIITNGTGNNVNYNVSLNTAQGGIEDIVGNALSSSVNNNGVVQTTSLIPTPVFPTSPATTVYIDQRAPPAPTTTLTPESGTAVPFSGTNTVKNNFNVGVTLSIANYTANADERWALTKWYSKDGGLAWAQDTGAAILLENGEHNIVTQYRDRAGNEGVTSTKTIEINKEFPRLLGISSTKPNGTYKREDSLAFNLDFADTVSIGTIANISLTLRDVTATAAVNTIALSGTGVVTVATSGKTVTFTWNNVNGYDMLAGLRVTALNLSGLRDSFGNTGPATANINTTTAGTVRFTADPPRVPAQYDVTYNLTGVIVSGITPTVTTRVPAHFDGITGNNKTAAVSSDNKTITLTFSKPMQRGNGTITIRPHGNYAIPAVFENEGYYLTVTFPTTTTQTETRSPTKPTSGDSTYISGMNDIYNNMTTAQRNYLITGGTLSSPNLNTLTGLSVGPYKKMTHGLKEGNGYTGNYTAQGVNAPSPSQANSMIPDTATKWVLDYQYQIHATTTPVSNIRAALTSVGFRRQQIAVTSLADDAFSNNNQTVTITLPEPLLPGLQWDLFYDAGTFTDEAGNPAAAVTDGAYWFWSRGVQKPVIRVDRKSYDSRTEAPIRNPNNNDTRQTNPTTYTDITAFNTVAYRIETETPGARIFYNTYAGANNTGSATGAWTGAIATISGTTYNWNGTNNNKTPATGGVWVQPNLVFRNSNTESFTVTENGVTVTHNIRGAASNQGGTFAANYYGVRSFNRDALATDLSGLTLNSSGNNNMHTASFTYSSALQASKNYVAAEARVDHVNANFTTANYTSPRGYEGVFRTVIALHQNGLTTGGSYILLLGTNVKSGIPTVAGFPVRDGVANSDTRYLKMFYRNGKQYYWVSTEIVSPWYMQSRGNGSAHSTTAGTNPAGSGYMSSGDSTDWITAGYGDLSYGFDVVTN
jgi:hypothetical protein